MRKSSCKDCGACKLSENEGIDGRALLLFIELNSFEFDVVVFDVVKFDDDPFVKEESIDIVELVNDDDEILLVDG